MIRLLAKLAYWLFRVIYRFEAHNLEAAKTAGPVLLLPNHVSWWDWILLGCCLDQDWRFVTSSRAAEVSFIHRWVMVNRRTFPVDMNSPYAVKHMAEYLQRGGRLVLFPEGRISSTGSLMKLFDGTGFLIHRTRAKVMTAYLRGAARLPFSRNAGRKFWFPKITLHISNVLPHPACDHMSAAHARTLLTNWLRDQMILQQFETEMQQGPQTLPAAILGAARLHPGKTVLQDSTMKELSYRRLLAGADLLARCWGDRLPKGDQRVGVLLPNVNTMPVVTLSLWAADRVPAVMNYSSGAATMLACARVAGLKQIVTSRTFVERSKLDVTGFAEAGIQLHYLEDVRKQISSLRRLLALFRQVLRPALPAGTARQNTIAVILFTSGSEGDPKAVALTHANLLANIRQMIAVVDLQETDRFFNALPLFHSFGLGVGLLLPLVQGVFVFLYLSPLHYRVVPSAFYDLACTVFFGTNTFLGGYARKAHPYDFRSARYLFAGAEKLQDSTSRTWMQKFGVRIIEGYGATECSPVLSVNTPMQPSYGSAGRFLPGIEHKLEPVSGVAEGGRLLVRGPNIMQGYLNPEPNARFKALGGWYDTGDIVRVDEEGFVHILGRLKRFAKISGEMVSLTAVEDALTSAFPQYGLHFNIAVVSVTDEGRGEKLIAVSNEPKLSLEEIREAIRARGLSNLAVPRELKYLHELPHLGSGKTDYRSLSKMV